MQAAHDGSSGAVPASASFFTPEGSAAAIPSSFTSASAPSSVFSSSTAASSMAWRTLPAVAPPVDTTMPGALGQWLVFVLHSIPSILFWVIGFATITVPTWLFTLFSMSLTFTMNFTTMYGDSEAFAPE